MKELGCAKLRFECVSHVTFAQHGTRLSMPAVRVASLYHKSLDDTMEEQGVVEMFVDQANEIVAMNGCEVRKFDADVAFRRLQQYL